jgi:hypothetical protein
MTISESCKLQYMKSFLKQVRYFFTLPMSVSDWEERKEEAKKKEKK